MVGKLVVQGGDLKFGAMDKLNCLTSNPVRLILSLRGTAHSGLPSLESEKRVFLNNVENAILSRCADIRAA